MCFRLEYARKPARKIIHFNNFKTSPIKDSGAAPKPYLKHLTTSDQTPENTSSQRHQALLAKQASLPHFPEHQWVLTIFLSNHSHPTHPENHHSPSLFQKYYLPQNQNQKMKTSNQPAAKMTWSREGRHNSQTLFSGKKEGT